MLRSSTNTLKEKERKKAAGLRVSSRLPRAAESAPGWSSWAGRVGRKTQRLQAAKCRSGSRPRSRLTFSFIPKWSLLLQLVASPVKWSTRFPGDSSQAFKNGGSVKLRKWRGWRPCVLTPWSRAPTPRPSGGEVSLPTWEGFSSLGNGGRRKAKNSNTRQQPWKGRYQ